MRSLLGGEEGEGEDGQESSDDGLEGDEYDEGEFEGARLSLIWSPSCTPLYLAPARISADEEERERMVRQGFRFQLGDEQLVGTRVTGVGFGVVCSPLSFRTPQVTLLVRGQPPPPNTPPGGARGTPKRPSPLPSVCRAQPGGI